MPPQTYTAVYQRKGLAVRTSAIYRALALPQRHSAAFVLKVARRWPPCDRVSVFWSLDSRDLYLSGRRNFFSNKTWTPVSGNYQYKRSFTAQTGRTNRKKAGPQQRKKDFYSRSRPFYFL